MLAIRCCVQNWGFREEEPCNAEAGRCTFEGWVCRDTPDTTGTTAAAATTAAITTPGNLVACNSTNDEFECRSTWRRVGEREE